MALQSSGQISLNDLHVEAGGSTGTQASMNDTDIRGLVSAAANSQMTFSSFYGASSSLYSATMTVGSHVVPGDYGSTNYGFNDSSESGLFVNTDFGSLTSRDASGFSNSGATIEGLFHTTAGLGIRFIISDNTALSNSGWSTLKIGSSTLSRTSATFTQGSGGQGSKGTWTWNTATNLFGTSGTKSITIV